VVLAAICCQCPPTCALAPSAGRWSCVDELFAFADSLVHVAVARATEMLSGGTVAPAQTAEKRSMDGGTHPPGRVIILTHDTRERGKGAFPRLVVVIVVSIVVDLPTVTDRTSSTPQL